MGRLTRVGRHTLAVADGDRSSASPEANLHAGLLQVAKVRRPRSMHESVPPVWPQEFGYRLYHYIRGGVQVRSQPMRTALDVPHRGCCNDPTFKQSEDALDVRVRHRVS